MAEAATAAARATQAEELTVDLAARAEELPALAFRADLKPDSIDEKNRTVDLVWSTGASVARYSWLTGEKYLESLSMDPRHVRLDRLNRTGQLLDSHSAYRLANVLGVVEPGSAVIAGGQGLARARFSKRPDVEPVWQDVRDGIIRNISVGYVVHKYVQTEASEGKPMKRHAVDWEPFEISAVPMPADTGAQIRSDAERAGVRTYPVLITLEDSTMDKTTRDADGNAAVIGAAQDGSAAAAGQAGATPEPDLLTQLGLTSLELPPADGASGRAANDAAETAARTDADLGGDIERARIQGIFRAVENARLPISVAHKLVADRVPLLKAQGLVLESLRGRGSDPYGPPPGPTQVRFGTDPFEHVWRGITGALLHRVDPSKYKIDDNSRQYRTQSLLRTMEECLEQRGVRTRGMSKSQIVQAAFAPTTRTGGLHGLSDFANILADVANKSLRREYEEAPQTFSVISRRIPMPDFKPVKRDQLGEAPALRKVLEHGEFTRGTVAEGKEQFALATYGKVFGISRQALINDDLDAFGRMATKFGRSARNLESDLVWGEILANAAMGDGVALFHATHGNLAGANAAIDVGPLGIGRSAMRVQKGLDGRTYLNIGARYLIVHPDKETVADQYVSVNLQASAASSVNPFSGRLTVVAEPRLAGITLDDGTVIAGSLTAWFLAATTDQIDIVEYGFLDGEEGPQIDTRAGFDVDGLEIRCRHDFAAKVIDWRGLFKNLGV